MDENEKKVSGVPSEACEVSDDALESVAGGVPISTMAHLFSQNKQLMEMEEKTKKKSSENFWKDTIEAVLKAKQGN